MNKQYRERTKDFKTVSVTIDKKVIDFIESRVNKLENANMSKFIEDDMTIDLSRLGGLSINFEIPVRRKYKTLPIVKKTFTFSSEFDNLLKNFAERNKSFFIEQFFIQKYNL
jgi:hypothetical protein